MAKNLVIVESPAKAKKISTFLGKDFQVESSFGHISDLPSKELGVDVEGDFMPKYIIPTDKKALVTKLKGFAKKADTIWLASDEDREGEAIAWHLFEQLKLKKENIPAKIVCRVTSENVWLIAQAPMHLPARSPVLYLRKKGTGKVIMRFTTPASTQGSIFPFRRSMAIALVKSNSDTAKTDASNIKTI